MPSTAPASPASLPTPPPAADDVANTYGARVQRTLRLLENSTPTHRNRVRILFYGQSIMGGNWHVHVLEALRARYPHAIIEAENRSLGGYAAQLLIRPAEHDLYPFQPDLLVFHVYGSHIEYENILRETRARASAEIMIMSDHWGRPKPGVDPFAFDGWPKFMEGFLRRMADTYACEHVDVRWPWKAYLEQHQLSPGDLLLDGIHLNDHGKRLMAALCLRQLVPYAGPAAPLSFTTDYPVGTDAPESLAWRDGKLTLDFRGNRVDLVPTAPSGARGSTVRIRIDGRPPESFPELHTFTRPSSLTKPGWPALGRIDSQTLPVPETWTLTLTAVAPDHAWVRFTLAGSVTGPDGEGDSRERFVSNSGRVVLSPDDWAIKRSFDHSKEPVVPGMAVTWRCEPAHVSTWTAPAHLDPTADAAVPLFHGLANGPHRLELVLENPGSTPPPLAALRVYRPVSADRTLVTAASSEAAAPVNKEILQPTPESKK